MSTYIITSTFVLSTTAWAFYKWSGRCRRRSDVILRKKLVDVAERRVSAPEQTRGQDVTPKSSPEITLSTASSPPSSPSSASTRNLDEAEGKVLSSVVKSTLGVNPVAKGMTSLKDASSGAETSSVPVTEFIVSTPGSPISARFDVEKMVSPTKETFPPEVKPPRKITPRRIAPRHSPKNNTADVSVSFNTDPTPASPSFPLSPSMAAQFSIPFTRHKQYDKAMRSLIQEWGFMASIRKKKLPLNKYGLPDVSADTLEADAPRKKLIDNMRKSFRDLTEERLISGWDDGSGFECVIDLFGQLLDLICSFVSRRQSEKFRKTLDIDLLKQMVKARVYTPEEFHHTIKLVVGLLYELESPYQHSVTQKWWSELKHDYASHEEYAVAICDSIMYLFRKCDLCKIEVENFYISRISPADRQTQERVAFERIPLPFRTPWDCSTKESFLTGFVAQISEKTLKLKEHEITSCLACDLATIHTFQNSLQQATVLSVMSVVLNNIFVAFEPEDLSDFFNTVLDAYNHRSGPSVIFDTLKSRIPESEHQNASDACAQIVKCADMSDPLYKVLLSRATKYLTDENASAEVFGLKPAHLCHANQRMQDLKAVLIPFVDEHWKVYGQCYIKNGAQSPRHEH